LLACPARSKACGCKRDDLLYEVGDDTPPTPDRCKGIEEVIAQDRTPLDSANQQLNSKDCVEAARLHCMQNIKQIEEKLMRDAQAAKAQYCPE
jgi:hypothetical protein